MRRRTRGKNFAVAGDLSSPTSDHAFIEPTAAQAEEKAAAYGDDKGRD